MMKVSFRFILATLAATAALVGCTKEITPNFENDKVNPEGSRIIAVAFAPQTKTELDGFQPRFEDGKDTVLISNTNALDTCVVSVKDNKATISTNLTGPLTAVYPYKAAKMNESNLNQIDTVLVSTVQSGKFADANICMARMTSENDESLSFENKTALFKIIPGAGAGTKYVEVRAEGFDIANDGSAGSTRTNHVATTTADSVYVSILVPGGLKVSDLTFSDGINVKTITTGARADEIIAAGTLYTVTKENWKSPEADTPEGAIKGVFTVGAGPDGKAGTADDVKVYFSQGNLYCSRTSSETTDWTWHFYGKQYQFNSIPTTDEMRTAQTSDTEIDLFTWGYSQATSLLPAGHTYVTAHTTTEDKQLVYNTDSGDDWGVAYCESNNITVGTWRTLSKDEWVHLFNTRTVNGSTGEGYSYQRAKINSDATGVYGMILYPDNYTGTAQTSYTSAEWVSLENAGCVFLPAAGCRGGSDVGRVGGRGYYWSSTAYNELLAYGVSFHSSSVGSDGLGSRSDCFSVRLVTDVSAAPTPTEPDYVVMKANVEGTKTLKWATKNLGATTVAGSRETCFGHYYAWGETAPYYATRTWDSTNGKWTFDTWNTYKDNGYGWKSYCEKTEDSFTEWNPTPYDATNKILKDEKDVAKVKLGDGWRMPTKDDFQNLYDACVDGSYNTSKYASEACGESTTITGKGVYRCGNYDGVAGVLFYDGTNRLFFPAAGYGYGTDLYSAGSGGIYWSSSLLTDDTDDAYCLGFDLNDVRPQYYGYRYFGCSVRPVSDL